MRQLGAAGHAALTRMATDVAFCTIFTRSHQAAVTCLARSLTATHPEAPLFALLTDRPGAPVDVPCEVLPLTAVGLPRFHELLFGCTPLELCCASKPYVIAHLLERGFRRVIFLDSDILVHARLDVALAALDRSAVLLTPHVLEPLPRDGRQPDEGRLLVSGAYHAGFVAVRAGAGGFVSWWAERVAEACEVDPERGRYLDQKYLDVAAATFDGVAALRDPGYNVAYWNLHERRLARGPDGWSANGRPLVCFHFSGFDPAHPAVVSRHQDRYTMDGLGEPARLFADYRARLEAAGHAAHAREPYGFGAFDDGAPVPDVVRRCFRRAGPAWRAPHSPARTRSRSRC